MAVIGFSIKRVEAKKDKEPGAAQITVNSTPTIVDLKETDIPSLNRKAITLQYEFSTKYEADIGSIKVEGDLLLLADDNKAIIERWNKEKMLPDEVSLEVLNTLFRRCLTKMVVLAEDLQLPPPVQFPIVKLKSKDEK